MDNTYKPIKIKYMTITDENRRQQLISTIKNHRKMWNWIADNPDKWGGIALSHTIKELYFHYNNIKFAPNKVYCYCCGFQRSNLKTVTDKNVDPVNCQYCPIDWNSDDEKFNDLDYVDCESGTTLYDEFDNSYNVLHKVEVARKIANLPLSKYAKSILGDVDI